MDLISLDFATLRKLCAICAIKQPLMNPQSNPKRACLSLRARPSQARGFSFQVFQHWVEMFTLWSRQTRKQHCSRPHGGPLAERRTGLASARGVPTPRQASRRRAQVLLVSRTVNISATLAHTCFMSTLGLGCSGSPSTEPTGAPWRGSSECPGPANAAALCRMPVTPTSLAADVLKWSRGSGHHGRAAKQGQLLQGQLLQGDPGGLASSPSEHHAVHQEGLRVDTRAGVPGLCLAGLQSPGED